jgi:hypothetical protein
MENTWWTPGKREAITAQILRTVSHTTGHHYNRKNNKTFNAVVWPNILI